MSQEHEISGTEIAVIGMAGRFPRASNVDQLWDNLVSGADCFSYFPEQAIRSSGIDPEEMDGLHHVRAGAVLEDIDLFDAALFGIHPREAELLDPQHRVFMECAYEALESSGYASERTEKRIGVIAGVSMSCYLLYNLFPDEELVRSAGLRHLVLCNDKDYLPTRVSYKLNLTGPSFTVQSACSSSLVAVHLACQHLLSGDCDVALSGGVSLRPPLNPGFEFDPTRNVAPQARCRAFDAGAQGTVGGSGIGIVVLKRLEEALEDDDCIYAVIRGSAISNDGAQRVSYTAPGVGGQEEVIRAAQMVSGIDPATVSYVEAHGAGTPLGDPIEFEALCRAYGKGVGGTRRCPIGSIKSNIGHLEDAAGIAGLIKTVLCLWHKRLVPSLNFDVPNANIDFEDSPFYLNTEAKAWDTDLVPRRAGVSSFGCGGTNVHMLLEEAPERAPSGDSRPWQLVLLSARTEAALEVASGNLASHLRQDPGVKLADVAYTLMLGRKAYGERQMLVARDCREASSILEDETHQRLRRGNTEDRSPGVTFLLAGLGDQHVTMSRELYAAEPVFREHVDECCTHLGKHLGLDLREVVYGGRDSEDPPAHEARGNAEQRGDGVDLRRMLGRDPTSERELGGCLVVHPTLFMIEYALARMWMEWGVVPQAMIGYSLGEYVAACLAGVLTLEDALALVVARARMIDGLPRGGMLAVSLGEEETRSLVAGSPLSLAAVNAPCQCVVAGEPGPLAEFAETLRGRGVASRPVAGSRAFHSAMMDEIREPLLERARRVRLRAPRIAFVSGLTGTWIEPEQAGDPRYWADQMCAPIRFSTGVSRLLENGNRVFLEIGVGHTLSSLVLQHGDAGGPGPVALSSLPPFYEDGSDVASVATALGRLWLLGVEVDWPRFYAGQRRHRVKLPAYPFERKSYWIEPPQARTAAVGPRPELRRADVGDWFHVPSWHRSAGPAAGTLGRDATCLVFADGWGMAESLARLLRRDGCDVIRVRAGDRFERHDDGSCSINPRESNDYDLLLRLLVEQARIPTHIVHCWSVAAGKQPPDGPEPRRDRMAWGFYSLLFLTQALAGHGLAATERLEETHRIRIDVVTAGAHEVTGDETPCPEQAMVPACCKTIPQELPSLSMRSIDLAPAGEQGFEEGLIRRLHREISSPATDVAVALRGRYRWVPAFENVRVEGGGTDGLLRPRGVYLMTGGLGRDSLIRSRYLAERYQARLILVGRSEFPSREAWDDYLANHGADDVTGGKIRALKELEQLGAEVLVLSADVADEVRMREALEAAERAFGRIHGVIHAAGITDFESSRAVPDLDPPACELHFRPKVHGLYVLQSLLRDRAPDFVLLTSSLVSVIGGLRLLAYAAASAFMDAFAHTATREGSTRWISMDWEGSSAEETARAFEIIMALDPSPQIVVSSRDLASRIESRLRPETPEDEGAARRRFYSRPNLPGEYVKAGDELEETIANVWQELLGIAEVGIHDPFQELGGDSLVATRVLSRVRDTFNVQMTLRDFFEAPTVAGLADVVRQRETRDAFDEILESVEGLSEEEIREELGRGQDG